MVRRHISFCIDLIKCLTSILSLDICLYVNLGACLISSTFNMGHT